MPTLLIEKSSKGAELLDDVRGFCQSLAAFLGEPVVLWLVESTVADGEGETIEAPAAVDASPISSADFLYREDGRPDWSSMWGSFCDLALYGGPPHRGPDTALEAQAEAPLKGEMVTELQRGVWETTGLFSEPAPPSWLAVSCSSKRMAAWMCAAIILENVDAKCEDEVLYVPASADFALKDEVKSVITVVAKVHHYWQAHVDAPASVA